MHAFDESQIRRELIIEEPVVQVFFFLFRENKQTKQEDNFQKKK
jgi:hypothetical protein